MADVLKLLVAPLLLLLAPLVWARVEPSLTKSSRLRRRISDHQALAEKLPPDSEAAKNLQAEIERQVNELVYYWEERRSKASEAQEGQPVRELWWPWAWAVGIVIITVVTTVLSAYISATT